MLSLRCHSLQWVAPDAFDSLGNLEVLDLAHNPGVLVITPPNANVTGTGWDRPPLQSAASKPIPIYTPTPRVIPTLRPTVTPFPPPTPTRTLPPIQQTRRYIASLPTPTPAPTITPIPLPTPTVTVTDRIHPWDKRECGVSTFVRLDYRRDGDGEYIQVKWRTGSGRKWPFTNYSDGDIGLFGEKSWLIYRDKKLIAYYPAIRSSGGFGSWHRYQDREHDHDEHAEYHVTSSDGIVCSYIATWPKD